MKIFYGICGEGLGHSGRALALIERLIALGHRVTIFTFGDALALLAKSGYEPHAIDGLKWRETAAGGVALFGTASNFCQFLRSRGQSLDYIRQLAIAQQPDLVITDFEPLTALAAQSLKIPCASVDNQHRFCSPLGEKFPLSLRVYGRLTGEFVRWWIKHPRPAIVAVFHQCPPSEYYIRVDALMRERIAQLEPTDGDHILIYGRSELGRRMVEVARTIPERFIAYGFDGPPADNIEYKPRSYDRFAADLASCRAVIALAGQQLMGEARYFGKPLLAVPMPSQHEQEINARYARLEGFGDYTPIEELSRERIARFLNQQFTTRRAVNGVAQTLELLGITNGRVET